MREKEPLFMNPCVLFMFPRSLTSQTPFKYVIAQVCGKPNAERIWIKREPTQQRSIFTFLGLEELYLEEYVTSLQISKVLLLLVL